MKTKPKQKAEAAKPFRFFGLPSELRQMVLKELFPPLRLDLQQANCGCKSDEYTVQMAYMRANLPHVLLASKALYAESIALYKSWSVTLVTYDILPSEALMLWKATGFKRITRMVVDEETAILPDLALVPSLKELVVHLCWDTEYGDVPSLEFDASKEEVLEELLELYDKTNISHAIGEAKSQGALPYKITIEAEIMLTCEHGHCDVTWLPVSSSVSQSMDTHAYTLQDILIDAGTRQFIRCGTETAEHEDGCPEYDDEEDDEGGEDAAESGDVSVEGQSEGSGQQINPTEQNNTTQITIDIPMTAPDPSTEGV